MLNVIIKILKYKMYTRLSNLYHSYKFYFTVYFLKELNVLINVIIKYLEIQKLYIFVLIYILIYNIPLSQMHYLLRN